MVYVYMGIYIDINKYDIWMYRYMDVLGRDIWDNKDCG